MITPDDRTTIPNPAPKKSSVGWKLLALFAVIGVLGLGMCGYSLEANGNVGNIAAASLVLMGLSAVGLVLTGIGMAIAALTAPRNE